MRCLMLIVILAFVACSDSPKPEPEFEARAEQIVEQLVAGDFAAIRSTFDANMTAKLTEAMIRDAWIQFKQTRGEFKSRGAPVLTQRGAYAVVDVPLVHERDTGKLRVSFDGSAKIAGLFVLRSDVP